MNDSKTKHRALSLAAAAALAGGAAVAVTAGGGPGGGPDTASAMSLEPFSSCEAVLDYADEHRWSRQPYPTDVIVQEDMAAGAAMAPLSSERAESDAAAVGPSETGTNVQEAGIDEPDVAKLSGTTLFAIDGRTLTAYDVSGDDAVELGSIELGDDLRGGVTGRVAGDVAIPSELTYDLLISGDTVVAIGAGYSKSYEPMTQVVELDVSDPEVISAVRSMRIEGTQLSARLQGETARLVVESNPDYPNLKDGGDMPAPEEEEPQTGPSGETGPEPDPDTAPEWLPQVTTVDETTGDMTETALMSCGDISYPGSFSGLGMVSVLTMDLGEGITPIDTDTVMTDGSTVYASATGLYVATPIAEKVEGPGIVETLGGVVAPPTDLVVPPMRRPDTAIHRFDTTDPEATTYASSGKVPGSLFGQFAMSEEDGYLRVASTTGDSFAEGSNESESLITVLGAGGDELDEVGSVGDLGPGEEIYAVRFIGDMGYVVTFEQTDPLYTVDLSDPANPETTGELKIPGYSAYLHPVADGELLGIGQNGTDDGSITGAQASLFDVSDPASPQRTDELDLTTGRYGSTATEWDHRAFLYWPEESLAVVPVDSYGQADNASAVAMRVEADGSLTELERIQGAGHIQRTLVADDKLVTVASGQITLTPLADLGA